jgi:hypothetical protein
LYSSLLFYSFGTVVSFREITNTVSWATIGFHIVYFQQRKTNWKPQIQKNLFSYYFNGFTNIEKIGPAKHLCFTVQYWALVILFKL